MSLFYPLSLQLELLTIHVINTSSRILHLVPQCRLIAKLNIHEKGTPNMCRVRDGTSGGKIKTVYYLSQCKLADQVYLSV